LADERQRDKQRQAALVLPQEKMEKYLLTP
jgi:hypothetical protein